MTKHCRIFIKRGSAIGYFMWVDCNEDESVYLGFPWTGTEELTYVGGKDSKAIDGLIMERREGKSKISFHASGHYKLESRVGSAPESVDRITVTGPPLSAIRSPRLMAELLLPRTIPQIEKKPGGNDLIVDLSPLPDRPLRCSIFCVPRGQPERLNSQFVDTSSHELVLPLENELHYWVWVFRLSYDDTEHAPKLFIALPGAPKFGQVFVAGA